MRRCGNGERVTMSILLGIVLIEAVAFAGFGPPLALDPNDIMRLDPNALAPSLWDWQGRLAEEIYRTEGAEVVPWTQESALPSPDNAALLYYQAFLLRPEPDDATYRQINAVLRGAQPDSRVRAYLGNCRKMIHTAEVASRVPRCTWGIRYLDADGFGEMSLMPQIRELVLLLALDARTLGADGHYEAALARCMTMRRLAGHVGDDTMIAYLVSLSADGVAVATMQHVLSLIPPDAEALRWLRGQLAAVPGAPGSIQEAMQADLDLLMERMRNDSEVLERIRQELARDAVNQHARERALSLTDEEIIALAREPYQRFLHSVFQALDSEMPYERKYAQIEVLIGRLIEDYRDDPAASYVMGWSAVYSDRIPLRYSLSIRHAASYNALKTAVEVYLAQAETGRLPQTLPEGAPGDPFSGREFEYEFTPSGFILRCRATDLSENRIWQYEFNVQP